MTNAELIERLHLLESYIRRSAECERPLPGNGLQQGVASFRLMADSAPVLVWMSGVDKLCTWFNRPWLEFRGRTIDQELGNGWTEGVHPDDLPRCLETYIAAFDARRSFTMEYRLFGKDGAWHWVYDNGVPLRDPTGEFSGYIGTCIDITERKQADAALRQSEERYRTLFTTMIEGFCIIEVVFDAQDYPVDYRFLEVNPAFEQQTGLHDPVGKLMRDLAPDHESYWFEVYGRIAVTGEPARFVNEARALNRWYDVSAFRLGGVESRKVAILFSDITEQKRAETALHEKTERLRSILDMVSHGIIVFDQRGIIESANPAAEKMFGYAAAEMIGQGVKMLMPPLYHDQHDSYLRRYLETREPRIIDFGQEGVGLKKDGSTFPLELSISPIDHLGLFAWVLSDIASRKALQKLVLDAATEEQRRIGQELHDGTGQELTGLTLFAGTLVDLLNAVKPTDINGNQSWVLADAELQRLRQTARRLTEGLIAANLHVQKLSHGIMPVQIEVDGLRAALEELVAATDSHQNLSCRFEYPVPIAVASNNMATHMYRVAQEAVNNAVKYSQASQINIALLQVKDDIVLEVSDNGIGFDPAAVRRPATSGPSHGFGLEIMNYRAGMIGGTLSILRRREGGMLVRCVVPQKGQTT